MSVNLGPRIHTRMTRAFKRVPTCHIGSAVHFHCTVAFKGQEATVSKMDSWTFVTCGYSFESSCHPGVDYGNHFNAHVSCWFHVPSYQCVLYTPWQVDRMMYPDDIRRVPIDLREPPSWDSSDLIKFNQWPVSSRFMVDWLLLLQSLCFYGW